MKKKITGAMMIALAMITFASWADNSVQYDQKTLPNGDVETSFSTDDGSKVVSVQHKNGDVESTATAADGTQNIIIKHADGSSDSRIIAPKKTASNDAKKLPSTQK